MGDCIVARSITILITEDNDYVLLLPMWWIVRLRGSKIIVLFQSICYFKVFAVLLLQLLLPAASACAALRGAWRGVGRPVERGNSCSSLLLYCSSLLLHYR